MQMCNMEVLTATEKDYDDVISIRSEIKDDFDYLPCVYREWLSSHDGFLLRVDGIAVAFCFVKSLDDGETRGLRSVRVREGYEGKGMFRRLRDHILNTNPDIKRFVYGTNDICHLDGKWRTGNYRIALKMEVVGYFQEREKCLSHLTAMSNNVPANDRSVHATVKAIDKDKLFESFNDVTLYPDDRIVLYWIQYRLLKSNIDMIFDRRTFATATIQRDGSVTLVVLSTWDLNSRYSVIRLHLHLFGEADETLSEHVKLHMEKVINFKFENISFRLFFYKNNNNNMLVEKTIASYFKLKHTIKFSMYCIEKNVTI